MKKITFIILVLLISCCTISCSSTQINSISTAAKATATVEADAAPVRYDSEEDFVKAIKTDGENVTFDIKDINYYYRPKNVPEGAILKYVEVLDTYVMFVYTFNKDKQSNDLTEIIKCLWFRHFDDSNAYIQNIISRLNCKEVELAGQEKGTKYLAHMDFSEAKAAKDETKDPAWGLFWVQDGGCFEGSMPWTVPETDIAKYLEMEKVTIQ
jgi:hypothetical protein